MWEILSFEIFGSLNKIEPTLTVTSEVDKFLKKKKISLFRLRK